MSASLLLDLTLNYLREQRQLISEDDEWVVCSSIVVYVPNAEIVAEMARRFRESYPHCPCFCDHAQSREDIVFNSSSRRCVVRGELLTGSEDRDDQRQRKAPRTVVEVQP